MTKILIWTDDIRDNLYKELFKRFGPYNTWGKKTTPVGKETEYDKFCDDFAILLSTLSDRKIKRAAVKQQIAWATTRQEKIEGYSKVFYQNIAAAIKAGFIVNRDLPKAIYNEYEYY